MKKLFVIMMSLLLSTGIASAQVWMATEINCNQFMRFLNVTLTQGEWLSENGPLTYKGKGGINYDTLVFNHCQSEGDDKIKCDGKTRFFNEPFDFVVQKRNDGTFKADLLFTQSGHREILGCLLKR